MNPAHCAKLSCCILRTMKVLILIKRVTFESQNDQEQSTKNKRTINQQLAQQFIEKENVTLEYSRVTCCCCSFVDNSCSNNVTTIQ